MEALKAIKIIGNQNDGRAVFFISSKYRVTKGFKFHARPQTANWRIFLFNRWGGGLNKRVGVVFFENSQPGGGGGGVIDDVYCSDLVLCYI